MAKLGEYGDKLETMTAQEVFDVACDHLLTQMKQSVEYIYDINEGIAKCLYDGGDDICCAAAPFIKGYNEGMEGKGWSAISHTNLHGELISGLQRLHDEDDLGEWAQVLKEIAVSQKLTFPVILKDSLEN